MSVYVSVYTCAMGCVERSEDTLLEIGSPALLKRGATSLVVSATALHTLGQLTHELLVGATISLSILRWECRDHRCVRLTFLRAF